MPPLCLMVKPASGACNMRCGYCFYADETALRQEGVRPPMTEETLELLVHRAFQFADGSLTLIFQGGEPTLTGADFYRRLLELEGRYNTRGIPVQHALQTNGLHLTDELLKVLQAGHFLVGLSMDGPKEIHDARRLDASGHGTWDRVNETAARLRAARVEYDVLCVVDGLTASQPDAVYDALAPHVYVQLIPCLEPLGGSCTPHPLEPEAYGRFLIAVFRRYARTKRRGGAISIRTFDNWLSMLMGHPPEQCGMAGVCAPNLVVESDGSLYPCDFYALDEWRLGSLSDGSLSRVYRSPRLAAFLTRPVTGRGACADCPYAPLCRGGCCREREGDPLGRNRLCAGYRLFFDTCLDDMRALALQLTEIR